MDRASEEHTADLLFRLLGPFTATHDGHQLPLGPPQRRAVLAVLLCEAGRLVTVERLAERMWGERSPNAARKIVQGHVSRLRAVLRDLPGTELDTDGPGYVLRIDRDLVDVHRFRRLTAEGRFGEALALWRGLPFSSLGEPAFASGERLLLVEERITALENRVATDVAAGRLAGLVSELEDVLARQPLRERCYELLMRVLIRARRMDEAEAVFDRAARILNKELGTAPGLRLGELGRIVRPNSVPIDVVPAQLPRDLQDFVGREVEAEALIALLRSPDSSTSALVGPGGVGKTALAVHVAHRGRRCYPDGQLFVDLQGSHARPVDPDVALAGFLTALDVPSDRVPRTAGERAARFQDAVRRRRILVVLDDASDADQVRPLLPPGAAAVITSRDRLAELPVDHRTTLGPLDRAPAFELFYRLVGRTLLDTDAVNGAVELSGGIPASIRSTASRLARRPHWTAEDVAASLRHDVS